MKSSARWRCCCSQFRPAPWQALPDTPALTEVWLVQQRAWRQAPEGERAGIREAYLRRGRGDYLAAVGARVDSALQAQTPLAERLVHFWANHFAVSTDKVAVIGLAGAFEADAIRPHALGRFEDLLVAAVKHPAMLLFLDQPQSIGPLSLAGLRRHGPSALKKPMDRLHKAWRALNKAQQAQHDGCAGCSFGGRYSSPHVTHVRRLRPAPTLAIASFASPFVSRSPLRADRTAFAVNRVFAFIEKKMRVPGFIAAGTAGGH